MGAHLSLLRPTFIKPPHSDDHKDCGPSTGFGDAVVSCASEGLDHLTHILVPQFALIIGINKYANIPGLRGAVSDARKVKDYLRKLHVPENRIHLLLNHEATRGSIIKALKDLCADRLVRYGDPILIFYAGLGAECDAPPGWGTRSKIRGLLPQDYGDTSNMIPDRTIDTLIEDIAKAKGNNITVIFDCCHSHSGTKCKGYTPRTVKLDIHIKDSLDCEIWGCQEGPPIEFPPRSLVMSHVLLAACDEHELAYESKNGGHFTRALLAILRNVAGNSLTYSEICKRVKLDRQTPRCDGFNRHSTLFDIKVLAGNQVFYGVEANAGKCIIYAGRAHGVSHGVEFTLYSDQSQQGPGVAVSVGHDSVVEDFKTTITAPANLGDVSFAKLARVGKVALYLAPRDYLSLQRDLPRSTFAGFEVVGEDKEAKLGIALQNNLLTFKILDSQVNKFGLTELPHNVTLDRLAHILDAALRYFWYLNHESTDIHTNCAVDVNFYLLKVAHDRWGLPYLVPDGPGYCRRDLSLDTADVIDFVVNPTGRYGIEIKNSTPRDLYLNAFLFNNSDLSIVPHYTQETTVLNPEPPLKKNDGVFTLGYGCRAAPPFLYSLEDDQDIDIGYLKIFFATRPINMSDIVQSSPFEEVSSKFEGNTLNCLPTPVSTHDTVDDIWFTILIPVVQRRK